MIFLLILLLIIIIYLTDKNVIGGYDTKLNINELNINKLNINKLYIYDHPDKSEIIEICKNNNWNNILKKRNEPVLEIVDNEKDANCFIKFVDQKYVDKHFPSEDKYPNGDKIKFSFTNRNKRTVYINEDNWSGNTNLINSRLTLSQYRRYLILHELGHIFNYGHSEFSDKQFNLMYQWTRGITDEQYKSIKNKESYFIIDPNDDLPDKF